VRIRTINRISENRNQMRIGDGLCHPFDRSFVVHVRLCRLAHESVRAGAETPRIPLDPSIEVPIEEVKLFLTGNEQLRMRAKVPGKGGRT
jgi:hypothetical protein